MCSEWTKITKWSVSSFQEEDDGYDILELTVKRIDKRVLTVIRLPLLIAFLIVILWNFSILPITYTTLALVVLVLGTYLHAWNTIVKETLIATRTVGIQVEQKNILGKSKYVKYVPIENIKAVIINEIIKRQRVISYLLIILEATESTGRIMVPLLTGTLPRLRIVERIYQQIQKVIF